MKKFIALALLTASTVASAEGVIANGTRFIYPSNDKEITVQLTNTGSRPALLQSWLDEGNPEVSPDDIVTPFSITPAISRVDGKSSQTLRIRAINRTGVPTDRESLWYLNVLEIPPSPNKAEYGDKNVLMMAVRSRFKFIYRPVGLGTIANPVKQASISTTGKTLRITNPTPFYLSITAVLKNDGNDIVLNPVTVAPKSTETVGLKSSISAGEKITVVSLNDFGSSVKTVIPVN